MQHHSKVDARQCCGCFLFIKLVMEEERDENIITWIQKKMKKEGGLCSIDQPQQREEEETTLTAKWFISWMCEVSYTDDIQSEAKQQLWK